MVFRHVSQDLKERCLWLRDEGYLPDDVCKLMGVSQRSLSRWSHNAAAHGSVVCPHNALQGRPSLLSIQVTTELHGLVAESPKLLLREMQEWLIVAHEIGMARSTVDKYLRDAGLTYKLLWKAASERDEEARAKFRAEIQAHFIAGLFVTCDETSKDNRTLYQHYGRAPRGERAVVHVPFTRGQCWSIVAAMSVDGYIAQCAVPGSVDGLEFLDFILQDVLPKMNPYPQPRSILLMDNCSIHKSETLCELVEGFGCLLMFVPPYSPNFNPIEESFSCLKSYLREHFRELQDSDDSESDILEACLLAIDGEKAKAWFSNSGYIVTDY